MKKQILCLCIGTVVLATSAFAADTSSMPPASNKKGVTYESDIKAIFDKSCVKCHSGDRAKARLHLDSLEGALKGTKEGPVVKPGKSAESPMILSVSHLTKDHDGWMPPEHNRANIGPLTAEEIGLLRAWIDQGAK